MAKKQKKITKKEIREKAERKEKIINYSLIAFELIGLIVFVEVFGFGKGLIYLLGFFAIIGIARAIQQRKQILILMQYIEIMAFGKPLEKRYWKKGEKITFRRAENEDTNKTRSGQNKKKKRN